jgi:hypothetical protein
MCPVCIAAIAQAALGATSVAGGTTALIVKSIRQRSPFALLEGAAPSEGGADGTENRESRRVAGGA